MLERERKKSCPRLTAIIIDLLTTKDRCCLLKLKTMKQEENGKTKNVWKIIAPTKFKNVGDHFYL